MRRPPHAPLRVRSGPQHLARHRGQQLPGGAPQPGERLGPPALHADPGHQYRTAQRAEIGRLDNVAPTTTPTDAGRPRPARLTAAAWSTISWATGGRRRGALHGGALRVGGGRQHEHPAVVRRGGSAVAAASRTRVGGNGHRVDGQRRLTRPGVRVGGHRGTDVATFGVGEDERPRRRSALTVRSSTANPAEPYASKNATCGLISAKPVERLDADLGERLQAVGVGQTPAPQQFGVGVDSDTHRPACASAVSSRAPKVFTPPRAACVQFLQRRTPMSPRMSASMPWTAAAAPCTVVIHGMSAAPRPCGSRSRRCAGRSGRTAC